MLQKKRYLGAILGTLLCVATYAQNTLLPYEDGELWGYKTTTGQVIIDAQYYMAGEFSEHGIAAVLDTSGWAYINSKGKVLVRPFIYDNGPDDFVEGYARYVANGKCGFFAEDGSIVIEAQYDFAAPFAEGFAAVCIDCYKEYMGEHYTMVGGTWGFIDATGIVLGEIKYEDVSDFSDGVAQVKLGKWFTLHKNGEMEE